MNLKNEHVNPKTKQVRVEKWIMDYDSYKIRDLIKQNEIGKSTESKIFSNLFKGFDKAWINNFSPLTINNYRKFKKDFKDNNSLDISTIPAFILLTLGSINAFSLTFKKLMDTVYSQGGARLNECVMIIGNHIINNFIRNLKKELNQINTNKNLNSKDWEINPIEFYNNLTTVRKSKDDKNNAENNLNILLKDIENLSEEQKSIIGYTVLSFIIDNSKYINKITLREDKKTYIYLNFTKEFYDEVFSNSVNTLFLPMICRPILWSKENVGGYISCEITIKRLCLS